MAYTVPTANQLQAKYPAFADVLDATIDLYIADAPVDETWLERDYANAIMLWAAHTMTLNGIGVDEVAGYAAAGVSRIKSGTLDVSFRDGGAAMTGYQATGYGRQFADLLKVNKGGPRVVINGRYEPGFGPTGILNDGGIVPWEF